MVQRELESGPGAARQNEAQSLKVPGGGNQGLLTGTGLSGVSGKKEKKSLKILTIGKHFCDKGRASPYEKASAVKVPERLHSGFEISAVSVLKPQGGPARPQQATPAHLPEAGLLPASTSPLAGAGMFSGLHGLRGEQCEEANQGGFGRSCCRLGVGRGRQRESRLRAMEAQCPQKTKDK